VGGGSDTVDPLPQIVSTSPNFSATSAGVQQGVQAVLTSPINGKLFHTGRNDVAPLCNISSFCMVTSFISSQLLYSLET
jgi:hypothetical protein